jgi:hypothetical protein
MSPSLNFDGASGCEEGKTGGGDGDCPMGEVRWPEAWIWRQDNAFVYGSMVELEITTELLQEPTETKSIAMLNDRITGRNPAPPAG